MRLIDADALDEWLSVRMIRFHALGKKQVAEDYNFMRTVLDAAPTIKLPGWIPVEEELPEDDGVYLVTTTTGAVTTARFYAEKIFPRKNYQPEPYRRGASWSKNRNVTHWMPLPTPPKEE